MTSNRRDFLKFIGASTGALTFGSLVHTGNGFAALNVPTTGDPLIVETSRASATLVRFIPLRGALPLETDGLTPAEQLPFYARHIITDELRLPPGFIYDIIALWGDECGDSRIGYNNDYVSFVETGKGNGFLTINFEYVSPLPWMQTFRQIIKRELPLNDVRTEIGKQNKNNSVNAFALPETHLLKDKIKNICREALIDQGLGVIAVRQARDGKWSRAASKQDRRITGISGLDDDRYLRSTGAACAVFRKTEGQGYTDKLGTRIIGSFSNCAGGTTPWGTVLSGEENYQSQVPEPVYPDGTSFDPSETPFTIGERSLAGQGNVFGLAGNKYGWVVEVDPANPADYGTKHTWLGRFRHEAVGVRVERGRRLAFYSGCDRTGGHLYKFVSRDAVKSVTDKRNSRLLEAGMLYAAKFNPDGTGRWISLHAATPVDPDTPRHVAGNTILLPRRATKQDESKEPIGGYFKITTDDEVEAFKRDFKTLGDLYIGDTEERQGAILVDAHYAANAAGATCTARPEDTEIAPDGSLYIAFTSGVASADGGSDHRIFRGPNGETEYEFGFIMRLVEDKSDPAALAFTWKMMAMGGEPAEGGAGFSNPDNLLVDRAGNLWVVTDMYTTNRAVPTRRDETGKPLASANLISVFGNNSLMFMPTKGADAGKAYLFAVAPMEAELTGAFLTPDERTMFLAVQHPGELSGIRRDGETEARRFAMKTTDGKEFIQTREVPIGSNFPHGKSGAPPLPAVVAIRRKDKARIIA